MNETADKIDKMLANVDRLIEIQELYEAVFNSVPWGVAVVDSEDNIVLSNNRLDDMVGKDLAGEHIDKLLAKEHAHSCDQVEQAVVKLRVKNHPEATITTHQVSMGDKQFRVWHIVRRA